MRAILTLAIVAGTSFPTIAQTTRALFLGNSYIYTNDLPSVTEELALSAGYVLDTDANTPGGYTFEGHSTNTTTLAKIQEGDWDFVVLQEQSQIPSFPLSQVEVECFPYAAALDYLINAYNPCAETVFFMTWGRENGDAQNCANWPPVCTYEGMDDLLYERYMMMADDNEAIVSPVGRVWRHIRTNFPEIDLYSADGSHPSAAGTYAAACAFFVSFFRADPTECTYNYTLNADLAETIRQAARDVVFNDLLAWHIGEYDLQAGFTYSVSDNYTVSFTNTTNGDADFYWWLGGEASYETNPVIDYPGAGDYDIMLIADNGCEIDTLFSTIVIDPVGIAEDDRLRIQLFPNPALDQLTILFPEAGPWEIRDISGKEKARGYIVAPSRAMIPISDLPSGTYLFRFGDISTRFTVLQ